MGGQGETETIDLTQFLDKQNSRGHHDEGRRRRGHHRKGGVTWDEDVGSDIKKGDSADQEAIKRRPTETEDESRKEYYEQMAEKRAHATLNIL